VSIEGRARMLGCGCVGFDSIGALSWHNWAFRDPRPLQNESSGASSRADPVRAQCVACRTWRARWI